MGRENQEAVWVAVARRLIYFSDCPEAQAEGWAQARLLTRVGPPGNRVPGGEGQPNPPADRLGDRFRSRGGAQTSRDQRGSAERSITTGCSLGCKRTPPRASARSGRFQANLAASATSKGGATPGGVGQPTRPGLERHRRFTGESREGKTSVELPRGSSRVT